MQTRERIRHGYEPGAGLGVAEFLKEDLPIGILLPTAAILLLFSATSFLHAACDTVNLHVWMADVDVDGTPVWLTKLFSLPLAGCPAMALIGLFIMTE